MRNGIDESTAAFGQRATFRLLRLFARANLSGHWSTLPNLIAGSVGMVVNNCVFLAGMWGMLFAGKPENDSLLLYYVGLNALFMTAWGTVGFFFGGFMELGELVTSGQFESKLSTPRHPLVLVAFHSLYPTALGDLVMGLFGTVIVGLLGGPAIAVRVLVGSFFSFVAIVSLFILAGSIAFFVPRGNVLGQLFREVTISLSVYPLERIFPAGIGRIILLLTPAGFVSLLPMHWAESATIVDLAIALGGTAAFFAFSLFVYSRGARRFQALSVVGTQ